MQVEKQDKMNVMDSNAIDNAYTGLGLGVNGQPSSGTDSVKGSSNPYYTQAQLHHQQSSKGNPYSKYNWGGKHQGQTRHNKSMFQYNVKGGNAAFFQNTANTSASRGANGTTGSIAKGSAPQHQQAGCGTTLSQNPKTVDGITQASFSKMTNGNDLGKISSFFNNTATMIKDGKVVPANELHQMLPWHGKPPVGWIHVQDHGVAMLPQMARKGELSQQVMDLLAWTSSSDMLGRQQRSMIVKPLIKHFLYLSCDVCGNYVCQKLIETADANERRELGDFIFSATTADMWGPDGEAPNSSGLLEPVGMSRNKGHDANKLMLHQQEGSLNTAASEEKSKALAKESLEDVIVRLARGTYSCRVLQKFLQCTPEEEDIVKCGERLANFSYKLALDQNANHVVQRCFSSTKATWVFEPVFEDHVVEIATHVYGCRVLQRLVELQGRSSKLMMKKIGEQVLKLSYHKYGNYVLQYYVSFVESSSLQDLRQLALDNIVEFCGHKFASNILEKLIDDAAKATLVNAGDKTNAEFVIAVAKALQESDKLVDITTDPFGNYIVQKLLNTLPEEPCGNLMRRLLRYLPTIEKSNFGRHIVFALKEQGYMTPCLVDKFIEDNKGRVRNHTGTSNRINAAAGSAASTDGGDETQRGRGNTNISGGGESLPMETNREQVEQTEAGMTVSEAVEQNMSKNNHHARSHNSTTTTAGATNFSPTSHQSGATGEDESHSGTGGALSQVGATSNQGTAPVVGKSINRGTSSNPYHQYNPPKGAGQPHKGNNSTSAGQPQPRTSWAGSATSNSYYKSYGKGGSSGATADKSGGKGSANTTSTLFPGTSAAGGNSMYGGKHGSGAAQQYQSKKGSWSNNAGAASKAGGGKNGNWNGSSSNAAAAAAANYGSFNLQQHAIGAAAAQNHQNGFGAAPGGPGAAVDPRAPPASYLDPSGFQAALEQAALSAGLPPNTNLLPPLAPGNLPYGAPTGTLPSNDLLTQFALASAAASQAGLNPALIAAAMDPQQKSAFAAAARVQQQQQFGAAPNLPFAATNNLLTGTAATQSTLAASNALASALLSNKLMEQHHQHQPHHNIYGAGAAPSGQHPSSLVGGVPPPSNTHSPSVNSLTSLNAMPGSLTSQLHALAAAQSAAGGAGGLAPGGNSSTLNANAAQFAPGAHSSASGFDLYGLGGPQAADGGGQYKSVYAQQLANALALHNASMSAHGSATPSPTHRME
ncbi:unnamed protein product [Amoebophrya sp. A120]|nr:unnamed protein product [Amoebophrya sp. A120]|eukprot:GSA120T00021382001.1